MKILKGLMTGFLVLGVAASMAPAAFAAGDTTSATVTGGSLSVTTPLAANFADASITGADQTTDAALAIFSVSDLTGSGVGWHVTAEASQFTGSGGHSLALSSLLMSEPTVAAANGTTSPDPTVVEGPYTIDDGAVQIASADQDEGMGKYNFSATTLTLFLPASVYADTYASTVTVSVITAP